MKRSTSIFICQYRSNLFLFSLSFLHLQDQRVYLEADVTFPGLSALVEHYHNHPLPSSNNSMPNYSLSLHVPFGYVPPRWHRFPVPCWNTQSHSRCWSWTRLLLTAPSAGERHPSQPRRLVYWLDILWISMDNKSDELKNCVNLSPVFRSESWRYNDKTPFD